MTGDSETIIRASTLDWDGDIGIRLSKDEAARLGIRPGDELMLKILREEDRIHISHLRSFSDGIGADEHDALLAEARLAELERRRQ